MIAIVSYEAGNIASVKNAVGRLGYPCIVTDQEEAIRRADKVIIPGVGAAGAAMQSLRKRGLDKVIPSLQQPVLGICLGQQLLCRYSEEGNTTCFGIFDAEVRKFPPSDIVPHMGWNQLTRIKDSDLLRSIPAEADVYYVHSYYCTLSKNTIATCDYIVPFSAVMHRDNFYATQFHPEKSAQTGELILKNFLTL